MEKVLLITKIPYQDKDLDGIGRYSQNIVKGFKNTKFIIIAQKSEEKISEDKDMHRVLDIKRPYLLLTKIPYIIRVAKRKNIQLMHIQYEFFSYGSAVWGAIFIYLLGISAKVCGIKAVMTVHQVPTRDEIKEIMGSERTELFFFIKQFYQQCGYLYEMIVHEKVLADRLVNEYRIARKKIVVINHPIPQNKKISTKAKFSNEQIIKQYQGYERKILFFGYLSYYKGIDLFIESILSLPKKDLNRTGVLIVGGYNLRDQKKPAYKSWIDGLKAKTANIPSIMWYGFAKDEEIDNIFSLSDALVLSYRSCFSSSGPFSFAVSNEIPVIVSEKMVYLEELGYPVFDNSNFNKILDEVISKKEKYAQLARKIKKDRSLVNMERKFHENFIRRT